jgi:hypothetical protein
MGVCHRLTCAPVLAEENILWLTPRGPWQSEGRHSVYREGTETRRQAGGGCVNKTPDRRVRHAKTRRRLGLLVVGHQPAFFPRTMSILAGRGVIGGDRRVKVFPCVV